MTRLTVETVKGWGRSEKSIILADVMNKLADVAENAEARGLISYQQYESAKELYLDMSSAIINNEPDSKIMEYITICGALAKKFQTKIA